MFQYNCIMFEEFNVPKLVKFWILDKHTEKFFSHERCLSKHEVWIVKQFKGSKSAEESFN